MEKRTAVFGISEEDLNSILEQLFIRRPPYPIELSVPESPARATLNIDEAPTVDFFEDKSASELQVNVYDGIFTSTDAEDVSIDPIINGLVLPFLIEYLSKDRVKYNIDIPPTALANAQKLGLGVPQVTVRNHQALAFSTSGKKAPDMAAPPGSWPAGVFVGADLSVLTAAANLAASQIEKEKNFGFGNIISGEMHARFGPISDVKVIEEGSTNLMSATTRGEQLFLNFRYMDHLNIERLMLGIPSWLNNIFHLVGRLEAELYTRISKLVVVLIRAWEFPFVSLASTSPSDYDMFYLQLQPSNFRAIHVLFLTFSPIILYLNIKALVHPELSDRRSSIESYSPEEDIYRCGYKTLGKLELSMTLRAGVHEFSDLSD
ncbi:predicted protein [Aspergillus terreus NIH2624]|uniref:Uncharacterized protein n=1 Tax=Aspergillus terreus (strain NIH 2624 / FGSC A1156) TaxID=341663 RepID=Q0C7V4_ASPTN|nr:uncharacterized protein ATEG_10230 [Aspergillus terreus NIH2624]EAU29227.1 predicted protein [Aspergillus terreus NIH2624]